MWAPYNSVQANARNCFRRCRRSVSSLPVLGAGVTLAHSLCVEAGGDERRAMSDRPVQGPRSMRQGVLVAFLAAVSILSTVGIVGPAALASAAALTTPTLTSVRYPSGSIEFTYTAGTTPDGATITGYQFQFSTDGGTTWSSPGSWTGSPHPATIFVG